MENGINWVRCKYTFHGSFWTLAHLANLPCNLIQLVYYALEMRRASTVASQCRNTRIQQCWYSPPALFLALTAQPFHSFAEIPIYIYSRWNTLLLKMKLGTELRIDMKCRGGLLAMWGQKLLLPGVFTPPPHWKGNLTITTKRNPETMPLVSPDSGQGKSKDKLPTEKEQRSQLLGKVVSLTPCAA